MKLDRRLMLTVGAGLLGGAIAMLASVAGARRPAKQTDQVRTVDRTESILTDDGTMEVFVARPEGTGPFPVIVQLMDGLGMREELRGHARRAASWGYFVVAPDLFYRFGLKGPLDFSVPADVDGIEIRTLRWPCNGDDCPISGIVWYDDFVLTRL